MYASGLPPASLYIGGLRRLGSESNLVVLLLSVLLVSLVSGLPLFSPNLAWAQLEAPKLSAEELTIVDARIAPITSSGRQLALEPGGTRFIEQRLKLTKSRLAGPVINYEAILTNVRASPGLVVHLRADQLRFIDQGPIIEVAVVYAVHATPEPRNDGGFRGQLLIRKRGGQGPPLLRRRIRHRITVTRNRITERDLIADFWGYRHYFQIALQHQDRLIQAGIEELSIKDRSPIPPTNQLSTQGAQEMRRFEMARRRLWAAHRHLIAASTRAPHKRLAKNLLNNLARPQSAWTQLPDLSLIDAINRSRPRVSLEDDEGTLKPVAEYTPGDDENETRSTEPPADETDEVRRSEPPSLSPPTLSSPKPGEETEFSGLVSEEFRGLDRVPDDPSNTARLGPRFYLPVHPRSLLLDDPNISFGGAIRLNLASVDRPENASTTALFYSAQAALTKDLGVEVTIPTQLIGLDIGGVNQTLYRIGNPLVALKYRFYLPPLRGRRPVLTTRARWGIAAAQRNQIPASDLFTEQFALIPNYADTYAFLAEKTDLGLGTSLGWTSDWLIIGAQFYLDYFFPTEIATDRLSFLAIGYGLSVGVEPLGPWLRGYLETRAVSLVGGPQRTELFGYAGARFQFLERIQPALWIGLPFGSASELTGLQFGAELRIDYDIRAIIGGGGRRLSPAGI